MNVEYGFPDLIWDWPVKNWQDIGYQPDLDQLKIVNDFLPEIPFTLRRCASTPMDYYQVEQENEMIDAFDEIFQELESKNDELIVSRLSR